jgi:hypothetical protein
VQSAIHGLAGKCPTLAAVPAYLPILAIPCPGPQSGLRLLALTCLVSRRRLTPSKDTAMADRPAECTVCNSIALAVQKVQKTFQSATTVSVNKHLVSTNFYLRCHACGNQWIYTALV